ncbi:MAG: hypothetical protein KKD73_13835 [Proteobacteria bacterium]|nr:hypothetical protein [Pseudomonadota bacterium]MBU1639303.1 hypothetical protein [Pseudomonadota bacterium]
MAIDGVSFTTVQDNNKSQNLDSGTGIKTPTRENQLNRAGQTSEAGQAVVAEFSAAALETSRAASEASQAAEENRMDSATERPHAQPQSPPPENSKPQIDLMV